MQKASQHFKASLYQAFYKHKIRKYRGSSARQLNLMVKWRFQKK